MRPRSITGPLILVGIGVLFLINNLFRDVAIWPLFADYWPIMLIGLGVLGLVEVLYYASRGVAQPPRPMSGGGFFWVFVIIMFAIWGSNRGGIHIGRLNSSSVSILGNDYDYDVNASSPSQGVTRVVLENIKGNLSVKGDATTDVKLTGHKSIRAFNKGDADRADQQSLVRIERRGDLLVVRAETPNNSRMLSVSTDLDLVVPRGLSVETRSRAGDLSVEDVDGSVEIAGGRGDIRLNRIGKDVKVETRSGLVRATEIKGEIDVQGRGSEVQIENVAGEVKINGEFSGTLEFRSLAKSLHFQSARSDLRVEQIPGSIVLDLGEIKMENVIGPVRFQTGSRDVHINDVTNGLELTLDRGDVQVTQSKGPMPKMEVRTRNGDITLSAPEKAGFELDARTGQGEAQNDYGAPFEARNDGRSSSIKGKTGVGPQVTLNTDRGALTIKKN
ncbi:MAG: hypothetical protein JWN34_2646 [Bryobacterales bacterium]|nr:hypothetical protein [Bryobacterales bacterium]